MLVVGIHNKERRARPKSELVLGGRPEPYPKTAVSISMKSKPWHRLEGHTAYCDRCGAVSQFRLMTDWASSSTGRSINFTFFRWWKGFKKAHRNCPNRNNFPE